MKRFAKFFLAGAMTLTTLGGPAWACHPTCRPAGASQGVPSNVRPQPQPEPEQLPPTPAPDRGLTLNDDVINDLPADAKLAIRAAARKAGKGPVIPTVAQRVEAVPGPSTPAPTPASPARLPVAAPVAAQSTSHNPTFNDRMAQVIATEQNLAVQTARLEAKRAELERWDDVAQEKFRRAFGTVDEAARQRIIQVLSQQITRNRQTLAALAEGVNLDFFLQSKQQH